MPLQFIASFVWVALMVNMQVASAQNYPNRPIRIVTSSIDSNGDVVSRLVAQGISGPLGQSVIVDNRASSVIPGETVSKASPDGHTLLIFSNSIWIGPLFQKTPYDVSDFAPISLLVMAPAVLVLNPSVAANSVKELIGLAKARPGELNNASGATGSATHLSAELFKAMAGINIMRVNYKGAAASLNAVVSGEVQMAFYSVGVVMPMVKSGRLKALAVTSAEPSALFPGLPTISASGLPGYESTTVAGMFAPARTPDAIINRLNQEVVRFLRMPETKDRLLSRGAETVGSLPAEFAVTMKSDIARMSKLVLLLKNEGRTANGK